MKRHRYLGDHRELPAKWSKPFTVNGQGTLIINTDREGRPFYLSVEQDDSKKEEQEEETEEEVDKKVRGGGKRGGGKGYWIALHVGKGFAAFLRHGENDDTPQELIRVAGKLVGIQAGKRTYWYSYDRDNLILKYGKGYRMEETTLMEFDFLQGRANPEKVREAMYPYFNPDEAKVVKLYDERSKGGRTPSKMGLQVTEPLLEVDKYPFIRNIPLKVIDSSEVNLFTLAKGEFVLSASLPVVCRELYENIKGCELDYSEDSKERVIFSNAIRYSIHMGILCGKLMEKQGELSNDKLGTYLRVTLGSSLGKSPGIPYVLEIWPAGHYSPVHNHGNANAVIKVLYGSMTVKIYNKQAGCCAAGIHDEPKPLTSLEIRKGDVLWINRNWYQTHKLENNGTDYCATIQCYSYEASDTTCWPYFDFISNDDTIEEFLPSSDLDFIEMRKQVMAEYTKYLRDHPSVWTLCANCLCL